MRRDGDELLAQALEAFVFGTVAQDHDREWSRMPIFCFLERHRSGNRVDLDNRAIRPASLQGAVLLKAMKKVTVLKCRERSQKLLCVGGTEQSRRRSIRLHDRSVRIHQNHSIGDALEDGPKARMR